jgi:RNA polymerase sigma factor (sigma-70 family)
MPTSPRNSVIGRLRTAALLRDGAGLGDGELLGCFIERRDEAAFAALVKRHGPMVWGVCRRLLSRHDAEDAFQAAFLVLVRKAASIAPRELVGNWLYGVAHQTALQARRTAARRRAREVQVTVMPDAAAVQPDRWPDVQPLLDQELSRLPDIYRAVIVLCELEGRTRKEVARQLEVPEGTVAGRLARARALLAKRLSARGVVLSGGALAVLLAQNAASAGVPESVASSTISAAGCFAAGQAAAAGPVSVKVAALTEGVLKAMLMSKLKAAVAVVLVLGFLATGATVLSCRTASARGDQPPAAEERVKAPEKPEKEKEGFTAWGTEVGGVQAGLGYRPGERRAYRHGETVTLVLRVRNVGKEAVEFKHIWAFFVENPPTITDADGKRVQLPRVAAEGLHRPRNTNVAPGKEVELYEWKFDLQPKAGVDKKSFTIHGTGKFSLQCERIVGPTSCNPDHPNPTLSKLATGKLELEVKDAEKAPEKEGFTAWGKEAGGLQAGLGFRPGERRAFRPGETVMLVVRVRNVGKETVKFQYIRQFLDENPPTVTDADGKTVPQDSLEVLGTHPPVEVSLEPGKEIELESRLAGGPRRAGAPGVRYELRPALGTGKVSFQYERVFGNSSAGSIKLDPTLSKLATGKLEIEINPDAPPPQPR